MDLKEEKHHHTILPDSLAFTIGGVLLFFTAVTVWVAHIDLGRLNFIVAIAVATLKAILVALFFMNLKYDRRENGVIFATSFLFLAIFIVLTSTDLFFRGDVYSVAPQAVVQGKAKSKFKKPWNATPELVSHGKALFAVQCVSCHGAEGKGDGVAAAALRPVPRDFVSDAGWKNGRKPSQVFKTLKEGLPPSSMASYATLSVEDRWALVHYVLSLGSKPPADSPEDLVKVGVNPKQEEAVEVAAAAIPVALAMERMAEPEATEQQVIRVDGGGAMEKPGAEIYRNQCLRCHGDSAQGGIKVRSMGVSPEAFVITRVVDRRSAGMQSFESFSRVVGRGLPGELMPGYGQLSVTELRDLYGYILGLSAGR